MLMQLGYNYNKIKTNINKMKKLDISSHSTYKLFVAQKLLMN